VSADGRFLENLSPVDETDAVESRAVVAGARRWPLCVVTAQPWFESLRNGWGQSCCDLADGIEVVDGDWDTHDGHYRVRLASGWTVVPDQAVVQGPNHSHKAVVWLWNEEALKDE